MQPKILLVHHDSVFEALLADFLVFCAYEVRAVYSLSDAIECCKQSNFEIAVIDLANANDCTLINTLSGQYPDMAVLALVSSDLDEKILHRCALPEEQCLRLPTPLVNILNQIKELAQNRERKRLQALEPIKVGPLVIDEQHNSASVNGAHLNLTGTEFALLKLLAKHAGKPVSKAIIYPEVLGRPHGQYDRAIDVHISSVRHKLSDFAEDNLRIESVRGVGYRLTSI